MWGSVVIRQGIDVAGQQAEKANKSAMIQIVEVSGTDLRSDSVGTDSFDVDGTFSSFLGEGALSAFVPTSSSFDGSGIPISMTAGSSDCELALDGSGSSNRSIRIISTRRNKLDIICPDTAGNRQLTICRIRQISGTCSQAKVIQLERHVGVFLAVIVMSLYELSQKVQDIPLDLS